MTRNQLADPIGQLVSMYGLEQVSLINRSLMAREKQVVLQLLSSITCLVRQLVYAKSSTH